MVRIRGAGSICLRQNWPRAKYVSPLYPKISMNSLIAPKYFPSGTPFASFGMPFTTRYSVLLSFLILTPCGSSGLGGSVLPTFLILAPCGGLSGVGVLRGNGVLNGFGVARYALLQSARHCRCMRWRLLCLVHSMHLHSGGLRRLGLSGLGVRRLVRRLGRGGLRRLGLSGLGVRRLERGDRGEITMRLRCGVRCGVRCGASYWASTFLSPASGSHGGDGERCPFPQRLLLACHAAVSVATILRRAAAFSNRLFLEAAAQCRRHTRATCGPVPYHRRPAGVFHPFSRLKWINRTPSSDPATKQIGGIIAVLEANVFLWGVLPVGRRSAGHNSP